MVRAASERPIELPGVPDGTAAFPVDDWRVDRAGIDSASTTVPVRTKRGRLKLDEVELRAVRPAPTSRNLDDEPFVLGAGRRRWATVVSRYGDSAWLRAIDLVRGDHVVLRCRVAPGPRLGEPVRWELTSASAARAATRKEDRENKAEDWSRRARDAARALQATSPEFATTLRTTPAAAASLPLIVHAAEDYLAGILHDGPRAFVQQHFGDTKARRDAVTALRNGGVPNSALVALGLRRSARLGVAGPVDARVNSLIIHLAALDGPVMLRVDQHDLHLALATPVPLVIIENLQAADAVADRYNVAVAYIAGVPSAAALSLVSELSLDATGTVVCTDADPGGVRIAERVLNVLPEATVLDPGTGQHEPRPPWIEGGIALATLRRALTGPAHAFARACLERGYPVEQEATIIDVLASLLNADAACVRRSPDG